MLSFYYFPEAVRVAFSMLTVINTGFTALVLIMQLHRWGRGPDYWLNSAASFLALCQTVINASLIAQVYQNISEGFVVASEYIIARYIVFAALTVVSVQWSVVRRRGRRKSEVLSGQEKYTGNTHWKATVRISNSSIITYIVTACSFLTLPFMETLAGCAFPAAFSTALAILLIGSVWIIVKIRTELITSISRLSVKQAMDSLDTAVLFCRKDGHILMQNHKMQELMLMTAGRVFYNGRVYLETVIIPNAEHTGEDSYLYSKSQWPVGSDQWSGDGFNVADGNHRPAVSDLTPNSTLQTPHSNESVWLFTVCDINAGRKTVTRITAADVTGQNKAAMILKGRNVELESRRQRLKAFVENIEQICRAEELLRIKTEIHDVQNQKLILLLQYLRYGELPDSTSFDALKTGILKGTCANADMAVDTQAMLDIIVGQHESIGVKININGNLPPKRDLAIALAQILQEAAANSVAHGYASEIHVRIIDNDGKYTMRVTDNGTRLVTDVKEGSGIAGMRRRAETCGGTLEISTDPCFTVTAKIPIRN